MSTLQSSPGDRNTVQDETALIWYVGQEDKQLRLSQVSRIIPGQRTAIFQRYPQPENEYQSFSLIYGKNSLNVDKQSHQINSVPFERLPQKRLGRACSDIVLYNAASQHSLQRASVLCSGISQPHDNVDYFHHRKSADTFRLSFFSALSTSSLESSPGDIPLSSIFMWGEVEDGLLDGGMPRIGESSPRKDALLPKVLESTSVLAAQNIAFGRRHAVLITRDGQTFSWGDGSGCGDYHTCAVTLTGDLYTWGDSINNLGLLGHGTEFSYWTPRKMGAISSVHVTSIIISSVPYHEEVIDDSKQTNEDVIEEISFLREQVEILTCKSKFLAAELEKTSNQLNEAITWIHDESEKNNAAKEAIKRLMRELEDMAARVLRAVYWDH
ncbi:hypothetical protein BUALT_Bualt07G0059900 [Buddleja alternifolia]|uniref:Uncharacterized protein n=1 Tax=Buddleja alternifolia TaxID=168488 RepID=A0AAV6X7U2_9LAMI|nr:hypothetical protein BUALT_Bualt07G0059900 [Buddleja alternifolia]